MIEALKEDKLWLPCLLINFIAAVWNWWAFIDEGNWLSLFFAIMSTLLTLWLVWEHPF